MKAPAVTEHCVGEISYTLTRRHVKNINLRLRPDGSVGVSAAPRVPQAQIDDFVASRAAWIHKARACMFARQAALDAQPLPDKAQALAHFETLSAVVFPAFSAILGGKAPVIKVRDMSSRWGVCHITKRQITFALRLYQMPVAAQMYVVVHEYCHFLVPNHSAAFWREVEVLLPDWKRRRALLRK